MRLSRFLPPRPFNPSGATSAPEVQTPESLPSPDGSGVIQGYVFPIHVPCPACGSDPGEACVSLAIIHRPVVLPYLHDSRRIAAAQTQK